MRLNSILGNALATVELRLKPAVLTLAKLLATTSWRVICSIIPDPAVYIPFSKGFPPNG
jgi:hypothetical protein